MDSRKTLLEGKKRLDAEGGYDEKHKAQSRLGEEVVAIGCNLFATAGVLWDNCKRSNFGEGKGLAGDGEKLLRSARFPASHGG